jgi:hypothetical protein
MEEDAEIFVVRQVAVETYEDLNAEAVAISESIEEGDYMVLTFQRGLSYDDQDRNLGMDTYCVSDERGATSYGCVVSWVIADHVLHLVLTARGAASLGVPEHLTLPLELEPDDVLRLRNGLSSVLRQ